LPRSAALARQAAELAAPSEPAQPEVADLGTAAPASPSPPGAARGQDFDSAFAEFRELVRGAGAEIVAEVLQHRLRPDPATLVGRGKVEEVSALAASSGASVILFDHNLTPTQLRNLEDALPVRVVDRTQLILDIFGRHARTREGQLQVELAQLEYTLPRLAGHGAQMSQLGGGIGTRGPGETKLETDRRRVQSRLLELRREIESVRRTRAQQRQRRESASVPTIALVGYTNAGKSTLFNRLTSAGVLVSSRMFATLDPKLRAITLPSRRKILLSDTVGFIRDLPPTLIASFRATLEEVEKAEMLLHVQDASNPLREQQRLEVEKVLGELGALGKPCIVVWNKIDLLPSGQRDFRRAAGLPGAPDAVPVSAQSGEGIPHLLEQMDRALTADPIIEQWFTVPQQEGAVLAALDAGALVQEREFSGEFVHLAVAGPASLLGRFQQYRRGAGRTGTRASRRMSAGPGILGNG
jgi:GTPase